jgi:hypothetical protein
VAAPEQTLEALVRDELLPHVAALVHRLVPELVAESLNGATPALVESAAGASGSTADTKVCRACEQTLSVDRFEKHRGICRECRRQEHERSRPAARSGQRGD